MTTLSTDEQILMAFRCRGWSYRGTQYGRIESRPQSTPSAVSAAAPSRAPLVSSFSIEIWQPPKLSTIFRARRDAASVVRSFSLASTRVLELVQ